MIRLLWLLERCTLNHEARFPLWGMVAGSCMRSSLWISRVGRGQWGSSIIKKNESEAVHLDGPGKLFNNYFSEFGRFEDLGPFFPAHTQRTISLRPLILNVKVRLPALRRRTFCVWWPLFSMKRGAAFLGGQGDGLPFYRCQLILWQKCTIWRPHSRRPTAAPGNRGRRQLLHPLTKALIPDQPIAPLNQFLLRVQSLDEFPPGLLPQGWLGS